MLCIDLIHNKYYPSPFKDQNLPCFSEHDKIIASQNLSIKTDHYFFAAGSETKAENFSFCSV